jgi:hypothetical protein
MEEDWREERRGEERRGEESQKPLASLLTTWLSSKCVPES